MSSGHKEASTIRTENIHIPHLLRIMKGKTFDQAINYTLVQSYVSNRLGELVGKRPVSTETVRKEVATLRVIWNWGQEALTYLREHAVHDYVYPLTLSALK